jgi:hypothetical protein
MATWPAAMGPPSTPTLPAPRSSSRFSTDPT